jgi:hypothetical protein
MIVKKLKPFVLLSLVLLCTLGRFDSAASDEGWRKEFERICTKVEVAGELKPEEIIKLIADADALLAIFESGMADNRSMKVYSFRLKKCRDFYKYIYKVNKSKAG